MRRTLTILVVDPNSYFSLGFRQGLLLHYAMQGKNVFLSDNMFDKHRADIVFLSAEQNASRLRYLCRRGSGPRNQKIFIIKERVSQYDSALFTDMDGILYRSQSLERAIYLINHLLGKKSVLPDSYGPCLSRREVEVIRGLSLGLPLRVIAENYALSVKTISSHKRRAMSKLGITRTPDLHYWLLDGGLDFLPTLPPRFPQKTIPVQI